MTQPKAQPIKGYELLKKLGQGGMGAVYQAKQTSVDRLVAIKILPPKLAKNPEFIQRFQREARAVAKLNHPNIVKGIDVGEDNGYHYFVMEFIDGPTVGKLMEESKQLPEKQALDIVMQISKGLEHAETKTMVHRDIKPDNLMITKSGTAKLADLGLAKSMVDDVNLTAAGVAYGTPNYIAPEQARGETDLDSRTDIYSLGATLFHMLTGQIPFPGETAAVVMTRHINDPLRDPKEINPEISEEASAIIQKMMAKKRENRYASASELTSDISAVLHGKKPPIAMPEKKQVVASSPRRKTQTASRQKTPRKKASKLPVILIITGAVVVAGIVAIFVLSGDPDKKPIRPDEPTKPADGPVAKNGKKPNNIIPKGPTKEELASRLFTEVVKPLDQEFNDAGDSAKYNSELIGKIIKGCDEIIRVYPGTTASLEAQTCKTRYEHILSGIADVNKAKEDVISKIKAAHAEGKFDRITSLANEFLDLYPSHPGAKEIKALRDRLLEAAFSEADKIIVQIKTLLAKDDLLFHPTQDNDAATQMIKKARNAGSAKHRQQLDELSATLKEKVARAGKALSVEAQRLHNEFYNREIAALIQKRHYSEAVEKCKAKTDQTIKQNMPFSQMLVSRIRSLSQREAETLLGFWDIVFKQLIETRKSIKLAKNVDALIASWDKTSSKIEYKNATNKRETIFLEEVVSPETILYAINKDFREADLDYKLGYSIFAAVDGDDKTRKWESIEANLKEVIEMLKNANREKDAAFATRYLAVARKHLAGVLEDRAKEAADKITQYIEKTSKTNEKNIPKTADTLLKMLKTFVSEYGDTKAYADFENSKAIEQIQAIIPALKKAIDEYSPGYSFP